MRQLPKLKMIAVSGIGTDSIALDEARNRSIIVSNVSSKTAHLVAEHALGLMLGVAKGLPYQTAATRAGHWVEMDNILLRGKTLGVIGTGNIGAEVARLGRAIGMRT